MASLVLKMSVSLDGYIGSAHGLSDWVTAGRCPDGGAWVLDTVSNARMHVMGSGAYAHWASYWPSEQGPFAAPMNDIPKVVFSRSLQSAEWSGTTIESGELVEGIQRLKQEVPAGYLLAQGGLRFARSLAAAGLIDEYRLVIHPVILGSGQQLFDTPQTIEPISTTAFSGGAVAHVFRVAA